MFKKSVFLLIVTLLSACSSTPEVPPPVLIEHPTPHIHVDPLPHANIAPRSNDFVALVQSTGMVPDKPGQFTLILENGNGTAAQYTDFARVHGERVHVMVIDSSLTDYHHLHPTMDRADKLTIFPIPFTPTFGGEYVVFADITPERDHTQQFLRARFPVAGVAKQPTFQPLAIGTMTVETTVDGYTFKTEIDPPGLRAGVPAMLHITVTDKDGQLFRGLEPIMQAFAHLIGFSADRQEIVHTHPMGHEITSDNERGGPNLMFHITFPTSGHYRLFLQVHIDNRILTIPFDASVGP